jgi:hypothetical protein
VAWRLLISALLTSAACSEDSLGQVFPDVRVCASAEDQVCEPPLDLGAFKADQSHETAVTVRNLGRGILELEAIETVSGPLAVSADLPLRIGPRRDFPIDIVVAPELGVQVARIALLTNDPDQPRLEADLNFEGVLPDLLFCPPDGAAATPPGCSDALAVDLGELRPGQVTDITLLVRNAGTLEVELAGANVDDGSSVFGELSVLTSTGPGVVAAGQDSPMSIRYQPVDGLPDLVTVTLVPADSAVAGATLEVTGAAPPNQEPNAVAVEYVTGAVAIDGVVGVEIWLDGSASNDPEGDPLQYSWSISGAPLGSTATLETPNAVYSRLVPDVLGNYGIQLQVSDSLGLVGVADLPVSVQPAFELVLVARWSDAGDVDLHVVPDGEALFGAEDCYFAQTTVDWGVAGDSTDDPVLFSDDESGDGEETIRVPRPAAGRYQVYAQYFDSRGDLTADVTVEFLADDGSRLLRSHSGTLTATCEVWHVGWIDWPSETVTLNVTSPNTSQCN